MLTLFKFLNKYDHEYVIWYDFLYWPWWDKTAEWVQERVEMWVNVLKKRWADWVIVPPVAELGIWTTSECLKKKVLPLFHNFVLDNVFAFSLVGKIWLMGDFADMEVGQKLFEKIEKEYKLTDAQNNIKKFHSPMTYRCKEVGMRKYFLTKFSFSNFMVNKTVKFDLHYFKDSAVDTLVPLNYGYFNFQKTITKFFNFKKTRFHKLEKLDGCFTKLIKNCWAKNFKYSVEIVWTGHCEILKREKKLMWLLQRGKSVEVKFV